MLRKFEWVQILTWRKYFLFPLEPFGTLQGVVIKRRLTPSGWRPVASLPEDLSIQVWVPLWASSVGDSQGAMRTCFLCHWIILVTKFVRLCSVRDEKCRWWFVCVNRHPGNLCLHFVSFLSFGSPKEMLGRHVNPLRSV